jgi:hypothetical protein
MIVPGVNVKGSAFRARMQYVEERGAEAAARLLAELDDETRPLARAGFLVNGWYPYAAFIEINRAIDKLFGKGDFALCRELGRYGCDVNLTTLYRVFFRLGSVAFILRRAAAAWRVNYDDGHLNVIEQGEGFVRFRLVGVPEPHRAHCLSVLGWITRAVELSGGKVQDVQETCRASGQPECEMAIRWK